MLVTSPSWSRSLTSLDITLLDNYSWSSIVNIGRLCSSLVKFHLTLWSEEMRDVAALDLPDNWRQYPTFYNLEVSQNRDI